MTRLPRLARTQSATVVALIDRLICERCMWPTSACPCRRWAFQHRHAEQASARTSRKRAA